jgi:hypothetical protein
MAILSEKIKELLSKALDSIAEFRNWVREFRLQPGWELGGIWAVGILVLLYAVYFGVNAQSGFGVVADILVSILLAGIGYSLFLWLISILIRWLSRISPVIWALVIVGFFFGGQIWGSRTWLHWFFNLILVVCCAMIGTGVYFLIRREWQRALNRQKAFVIGLLALGVAGITMIGVLIISPGSEAQPLVVDIKLGSSSIEAANPSNPGSYSFQTLTYGSGTDLRRPEYGQEVDLLTKPVNGAYYVNYRKEIPQNFPDYLVNWGPVNFFMTRFSETLRKYYWGFGVNELPLNGRVWSPEGKGPFPLVLLVHGNHSMVEKSEIGYAYLGELLASRGYILVSVDENFLNGGFWGRASGENDARAWLLLQHLKVWEDWNEDPNSPFYQQVDLSRIALIGHSRGGEAVALATTFNNLSRYPNNAKILWDFGFNIRSVIALAPVDEQWMPADHSNPLIDINYLVLQGSHDGDVYYFDGIQQYNRTNFSGTAPDVFKAAVYIYRANHGQFNSLWGSKDKTGIAGQFLNTKALMSQAEQQQIAKLYISAFLEDTLKDKTAYREIFKDYRSAGDWLPQTGYISQYEDNGGKYISDFEEDVDVTTNSLEGGRVDGYGLTQWSEISPRFRNKVRQDNHVVRVGWSNPNAYYALQLPADFDWILDENAVLVFKTADARTPNNLAQGLDFSILLVDSADQKAELVLSTIMPLQTQFPAEISRLQVWNDEYYQEFSEEVFQTYRIRLGEFLQQNPSLNLQELDQIRFDFNQMDHGLIYLDDIGFDLIP